MKIPNLSKKQSIAILLLVILIGLPEIYLFIPYFLIIKPAGENNTDAIISEVKKINQTDKKLQRIVEWETDGFTESFGNDPSFRLPGILGWIGASYGVYFNISNPQPIKIRPRSIVFYDDPYWIAYFKTGACSERASLFNFIANQSGEVTRIVSAPGNDHEWVEVNNGNEWIYADPTFYFHYHNSPGREHAWMDKTPILQESWGWHLCKVITKFNDTELTDKYTEVGNLSIIYHSSNRVYINRFLSGEHRNVTLFSKQMKESSHKDIITYQLGLSNEYIVVAEKNNYPFPSKWIDEKVVLIDNESTTVILNPESGREEVDYMAIGAFAVCIVAFALLAYWIYRDSKREKERR